MNLSLYYQYIATRAHKEIHEFLNNSCGQSDCTTMTCWNHCTHSGVVSEDPEIESQSSLAVKDYQVLLDPIQETLRFYNENYPQPRSVAHAFLFKFLN